MNPKIVGSIVSYAVTKTSSYAPKASKTFRIPIGRKNIKVRYVAERDDILSISKESPRSIKSSNLYDRIPECQKYIGYSNDVFKYIKRIEGGFYRLRSSLNPRTLPVLSYSEKVLHISNFKPPYGTIAIASGLDKTISTNGLHECAALAIVDKKHNLQVLVHCFPGEDVRCNRVILDYIFSRFKKSTPEITIVPGRDDGTDKIISFLVDNIKDILGPKCKIKFAQAPDRKYSFIALRNGELGCSIKYPEDSEINIPDKIIFCNKWYKVEDGRVMYLGPRGFI